MPYYIFQAFNSSTRVKLLTTQWPTCKLHTWHTTHLCLGWQAAQACLCIRPCTMHQDAETFMQRELLCCTLHACMPALAAGASTSGQLEPPQLPTTAQHNKGAQRMHRLHCLLACRTCSRAGQ